LDKYGETYHLLNLCRQHHKDAHDEGTAIESGLLLDGYCISGTYRPIYTGSDPYLSAIYGPEMDVPVVRGDVRGDRAGEGL